MLGLSIPWSLLRAWPYGRTGSWCRLGWVVGRWGEAPQGLGRRQRAVGWCLWSSHKVLCQRDISPPSGVGIAQWLQKMLRTCEEAAGCQPRPRG